MTDDRHELARQIYETAHLTGEFLLRSGVTSNEYFDKYLSRSQSSAAERYRARRWHR